jgi:hypothetical protein
MSGAIPRHQPLSEALRSLVEAVPANRPLTLNTLLHGTGARGALLVAVLLCLPFSQPIPLPGLSSIIGLVLMIMGVCLAAGTPMKLPRSLGDRPLPVFFRTRLLAGSIRVLRWVERWVKPRRNQWIHWRGVRILHGMAIVLMALLLSLPIPLPFTNQPPSIVILLLALGMMEEDGVTVTVAYVAGLATALYFGLFAGAFLVAIQKMLAAVGLLG